jgi:surface antigen
MNLKILFALTANKKLLGLILAVMTAIVIMPIGAALAVADLPTLIKNSGSSASSGVYYDDPITPGDGYDYGYCTYWAALRRIQVGNQIPNNWGDAHSWDDRAILAGYEVDHTPAKYAIMQTDYGSLGHVAFVEDVAPDGSWTISEMNAQGWNVVDTRTFTASQAEKYNFIHDKEGQNGL